MNYSEEQLKVIENSDSNMYIASGPGSGKSTVLAAVSKKLLENPDNNIMLITFTNKAAKSIMHKAEAHNTDNIVGGTFHRISYRLMKSNGINLHICDENKKRILIKKVFDCRRNKDRYEEVYKEIAKQKSHYPVELTPIVREYQDELNKFNMIDFDDIINYGVDFIYDKSPKLKISHMLIDELQDTSQNQLELLKAIQKITNCKVIGVGDNDQCQPSGTKILTTNEGYKNIEELDEDEDEIPSYSKQQSYIIGLKEGYRFDKSSRMYTGNMFKISINDKSTKCTYNHKWNVKWSKDAKSNKNINIVYLMKKDNNFRIGWCQLFNSENTFHLGIRARLEKADGIWILKKCLSKAEASAWESIYSTKYSIPTLQFISVVNPKVYTQEIIDFVFNELNTNNELYFNAIRLLNDINKSIDFPLWSRVNKYEKQGSAQIFIVQACNLDSDLMILPEHLKGKKLKWSNFNLSNEYVEDEKVYSLNVKPYHTYISDGIITCNSIFEWRHARPENVKNFISVFKCKVYQLGLNFRSKYNIVKHSRILIEHNKNRIEKNLRSYNAEKGCVKAFKCWNIYNEIDKIIEIYNYSSESMTILYRDRLNKMKLEYGLKKAGIDYRINDSLGIVDRSAFRVLLSMLKISANIYDIYDLEEASKGMKRVGGGTIKKVRDEMNKRNSDTSTAVTNLIDKGRTKNLRIINELQSEFKNNKSSTLDVLINILPTYIITSFDIPRDIIMFLSDICNNYHITITDIRDLCNDFGLDNNQVDNDDDHRLTLSTLHSMKGLEDNVVVIAFCNWEMRPDDNTKDVIEAERRLFYVGVTRAKSALYMTYSSMFKPRFINEMGI